MTKKVATKKKTSPQNLPTTSSRMTTGKQTLLHVGGLVITEEVVVNLMNNAGKSDYWKAKALGYHLALQQQQRGLSRMKKKLDRLQGIIAKREAALEVQGAHSTKMADRLNAVRAFANPDAQMIRFSETGNMPEPIPTKRR